MKYLSNFVNLFTSSLLLPELSVQVSPLLKHAVSLHRRMPQSLYHALHDDCVVDTLESDYFLEIVTLMQ